MPALSPSLPCFLRRCTALTPAGARPSRARATLTPRRVRCACCACRAGEDIPEWFAFKSVVSVLREAIAEESASESE